MVEHRADMQHSRFRMDMHRVEFQIPSGSLTATQHTHCDMQLNNCYFLWSYDAKIVIDIGVRSIVPSWRASSIPHFHLFVPPFFLTDIQKKQPGDQCAPKTSSNSSSSQPDVYCSETNSSTSQSLISTADTPEDPSPGGMGATSLPAQDGKKTVKHSFFSYRSL